MAAAPATILSIAASSSRLVSSTAWPATRTAQADCLTIISLIFSIAREGASPLGQTPVQFIIVRQRHNRYGSFRSSTRSCVDPIAAVACNNPAGLKNYRDSTTTRDIGWCSTRTRRTRRGHSPCRDLRAIAAVSVSAGGSSLIRYGLIERLVCHRLGCRRKMMSLNATASLCASSRAENTSVIGPASAKTRNCSSPADCSCTSTA